MDISQIPVTEIKGVGPKMSQRLGHLGIFTVYDLLFHFPFRFEDITERSLESVLDQEKVTLKGIVMTDPAVHYYGGRKNRMNFKLQVGPYDLIDVVFFNQAYLAKQVAYGNELAVYGKWQAERQQLLGSRLIHPQSDSGDFAPVYSTTEGLSQGALKKIIQEALTLYAPQLEESIPEVINTHYRLLPLPEALQEMHRPTSAEKHHQAERKIIYQELFLYQWRLQLAENKERQKEGIQVLYEVDDLKEAIAILPFQLTQAQKRSVNEICADLLAPYPMRRILQGDVGSGKTLVAFIAMLATVFAGYQAALMVPTEILARQHLEAFNSMFETIGLRAEVLISDMKTDEKKDVLDGLKSGRIRLVIGTHALIQEAVAFKHLGLVIIDEQHRFGVNQRQALLTKGEGVNLLQMTATPIPRSLSLTYYGGMQVSTIDELPAGRKKVETLWFQDEDLDKVYKIMHETLERGEQVYYVLPLIESSEHMSEVQNVEAVVEQLKNKFTEDEIGSLHGQMDKDEQQEQIKQFVDRKTKILVATTIIEVGVNIPNATLMVIQGAERFGLAQLHQLRGRVGRSDLQATCILIGKPTTPQGQERLKIMVDEHDGFLISEADLKIRGSGDLFGTVQAGLPVMNYANLVEDQNYLQAAQKDVQMILQKPSLIEESELNKLLTWEKEQELKL